MPNGDEKKEVLPESDSVFKEFVQPKKFGMGFATQPAPTPEPVETAQQPAQTTEAQKPLRTVEVVLADGTKIQEPLPATQQELEQSFANYKSLEKSYEALKGVVKEKAPELADDLRPLLKQQTEILNKMADAQVQAQQNQPIDPVKLLSEEQHAEYNYRLEQGDERGAKTYLDSAVDVNYRIWQAEQKSVETEKRMLEQKVNNRISEFCQLDPSLPNPKRSGDGDSFARQFNTGYGGWLQRMGFSEAQIWFSDNIDHETLYNTYLNKTGQSKQNNTTPKETPVKTVEPAKAAIPHDVAKSIQDVQRGSVSASIGGDSDGSQYRNVHGRSGLRKLAQDNPNFVDDILKGTGIEKFITKRKK